jgi:hypothetical protein
MSDYADARLCELMHQMFSSTSESEIDRGNVQRDYRIDVFRGLAIVTVLVDHIEFWAPVVVLRNWTLRSFGFSDAAELFVFLSGYSFGIAYTRRLELEGFCACQLRAVRRSFEIYVVYVITAWTLLAGGVVCSAQCPALVNALFLDEGVLNCGTGALTLEYQPYGFSMLAVYIVVLPLMPCVLWIYKRSRTVAVGISLSLYVAAQLAPGVRVNTFPDGREWMFNPFAWQFLFILGLIAASTRTRVTSGSMRLVFVLLATAILLLGLLVVKLIPQIGYVSDNPVATHLSLPWIGKGRLEPWRIIHFCALAYLSSLFLRPQMVWWSTAVARPLVISGQHSLETYAFGLLIMFASIPLHNFIGYPSIITSLLIDLDAVLMSVGFAYCLQWLKRRRHKRRYSFRKNLRTPCC